MEQISELHSWFDVYKAIVKFQLYSIYQVSMFNNIRIANLVAI